MKDSIYTFVMIFLVMTTITLGIQVERNSKALQQEVLLRHNMEEDYKYQLGKLKAEITDLKEEHAYLKSRIKGWDETIHSLSMIEIAKEIDRYIENATKSVPGVLVN